MLKDWAAMMILNIPRLVPTLCNMQATRFICKRSLYLLGCDLNSNFPKIQNLGIVPKQNDILTSYSFGKISKNPVRSLSAVMKPNDVPLECDVLIVGGGAVGSSVAYHLAERVGRDMSIVVVEADDMYKTASTVLSMGCIRQQFSVPENIYLSRYGIEFLKAAHHLLEVPGYDPPDVQFHPRGYLMLASDSSRDQLLENYKIQIDAGARVELLSTAQLKSRYPWMVTDGIAAAVIGVDNEGWFDPWTLLTGFRRKATSLGVRYVQGRVTAITDKTSSVAKHLNTAKVNIGNEGESVEIEFSTVVLAAGMASGKVGKLAGIGTGEGVLAIPIPVEPRKRYVFCVHVPKGPVKDCPIFCDYTGAHFRPEASPNIYLCIKSPMADQEPPIENLEVDHTFFDSEIWPRLANRIPSFENLKVRQSWAGYYDYNTLDQNAIIGRHPVFSNMILATGFSGHGIQHAAGTGRAVMEHIVHGNFCTINLERFSFERVIANQPLYEKNIL